MILKTYNIVIIIKINSLQINENFKLNIFKYKINNYFGKSN